MNSMPRYQDSTRSDVATLLPQSYNSLLEIGCARGGFSKNIPFTVDAWAVEANVEAAQVAATRFRRLLVGEYKDVESKLPDNYFEVVVCNDVIEHIADHLDFLASVSLKIKQGGILLVSIPNVRYWEVLWGLLIDKDWMYKASGVMDYSHLRFFTKKSITRDLLQTGFQVDEITGKQGHRNTIRNRVLVSLANLFSLGFLADAQHYQFIIRAHKI